MKTYELLLLFVCFGTTQARYVYAVACLPLLTTIDSPECYMTLLTKVTSFVEISTVNEITTMTLAAGTLYREDFTLNPTRGTEAKAIHVTSDEPLLVVVYRGDSWESDAYQIPPLQEDSNDFLTTAYISNDSPCASSQYKEFYLVASFYNDTSISIQQQDGVRYDLVLSEYELFSQKTLDATYRLASGTRIRSSNPIAVISGNLCIFNRIVGSRGAYASTIPPLKSLGSRYVLPNLASDYYANPAGFSASVVATENNTAVESEGDVRYLDKGETAIFEYPYQVRSVVVNCSRVCLVAQYSKSWYSYNQGFFMLHGMPEHMYQMSAYLSALSAPFPTFLSLIAQGEEPGQDIFLNGVSLQSLNWTAIDGFTSASLSIPPENHELQSVNGRPFTVFVYGQGYEDIGAGYTYYPITTPISPSPTTPTPTPPMDTYPEHTARVTGTAVTADGLPQTPQCALAHLNNLDQKAKEMVLEVNRAIGETICVGTSNIVVARGKAATFNQGNKTSIEIDHTFLVHGHHTFAEVEACGGEVADYLADLSNWWRPIFPPVQGCSNLDIEPAYFNASDTFWVCADATDEEGYASTLAYESKVSEVLTTADGSALNVDCMRSYTDEADDKAAVMMAEIVTELEATHCGDVVAEKTYLSVFSALDDQAFFGVTFYYQASGTSTLAEFASCMRHVHAFSLQHANWSPQPGGPFLPVPPRCPALEHDSMTLDDQGRKWVC